MERVAKNASLSSGSQSATKALPGLNSLHDSSCVCTAVRRASRAVSQLYDLVLAPVGLKASQFVVLQALAEHGELAQYTFAKEYVVSVETLSRRLAVMRKAGWIEFRLGERKREHLYRLTPAGIALLNDALPHWRRAEDRLASALGNGSDLRKVLRDINVLTRAACNAQSLRTVNVTAGMPRPRLDGAGHRANELTPAVRTKEPAQAAELE